MSKLFVLCIALFGVLALSHLIDQDNIEREFLARHQFERFVNDHGRNYKNTDEKEYRYKIFRENLDRMEQMAQKNPEATFGINKFADLHPTEFKARHLGYKPQAGQAAVERLNHPVYELESQVDAAVNVDWRTKGAVTPVKDQGQCGSCWAFSATQGVESAWFLAGHSLPILAPQQVVSCDKTDGGCNGGDLPTAFAYIKGAGMEAETSYPYKALDGKCSYDSTKVVAKMTNWTYATAPCSDSCDSQNEDDLAQKLAAVGPSSICVYAESWQFYSGGVFSDASSCPHGYNDLDHCVQLVAVTTDSTGSSYWTVKNSWSDSWGDNGYIHIKKGSNLCGIADEATFVFAQ